MNATDNEVCEILRMKFSVPRETEEKLSRFHDLIIKWQSSINLISNTTREHIWRRHILDSAQLLPLIDDKEKIIADIGSGAGFPGLILSILGCKNIHLIESDARKSAFLREAARQVEAPITLHTKRVESLHIEGVNIITSRACASIQNLLEYAKHIIGSETMLLLHKGNQVADEITEAAKHWNFTHTTTQSITDISASIVTLTQVSEKP